MRNRMDNMYVHACLRIVSCCYSDFNLDKVMALVLAQPLQRQQIFVHQIRLHSLQ